MKDYFAVADRALTRYVESRIWWSGVWLVAAYTVTRVLCAAAPFASPLQEDTRLTLAVVERCLAFVSTSSFLSFGLQLDGLIGSKGLSPASDLISQRRAAANWQAATWTGRLAAMHKLPTIFWLTGASDSALRCTCASGLIASLAIMLGGVAWSNSWHDASVCCLWLSIYACHLSLIAVSGDFLGLQSDSNQCEVAAILALSALLRLLGDSSSSGTHEGGSHLFADSSTTTMATAATMATTSNGHFSSAAATIQVLRWLALRKMMGCGLCKYYGSPMWRAGTAMEVHYWTQPLPNPLSSTAHRLPKTAHRLACLGTFAVEVGLPILGGLPMLPKLARLLAFSGFVGINLAINLSGSYGMIGALSVAESLSLLDDSMLPLPSVSPGWIRSGAQAGAASGDDGRSGDDVAHVVNIGGEQGLELARPAAETAVLMVGRLLVSLLLCAYVAASLPPVAQAARDHVTWPSARVQDLCERLYRHARRFRLVNYYAKFASMHAFRWEVLLEGSEDGEEWKAYAFRYKPWSAHAPPRWVPLHLPRLDWRLWFLPLGCRRQREQYAPPAWLPALLRAVHRHEPSVLALLDMQRNPFPDAPPRMLRTRVASFRFPDSRAAADPWEVVPLPVRGKWDTSGLCLLMTRQEALIHNHAANPVEHQPKDRSL